MNKKLCFHGLVTLLLLGVLALGWGQIRQGPGENYYVSLHKKAPIEYVPTITLYHVVSHKTMQGSVTGFLMDRAKAFMKLHPGVYLEVEGMDEEAFYHRLSLGRRPQLYSFFSGALYEELLQAAHFQPPELRPGLSATAYAAPWLFSGYVKLSEGQGAPVPTLLAGEGAAVDLRAYAALEEGPEAEPLSSFTDEVCYLGIDRDTDEVQTKWCLAFYDYLMSEKNQQLLFSLGAFSPRLDVSYPYGNGLLLSMDRAFLQVSAPDPFLYHTHKDSLKHEAEAALAGDEEAKNRFFQRLAIVIDT
ncbi:MAG: hypothetical protein IJR17_02530 [Clostridia bacterium]|nr:hypothetical protein [Clostridia bacterium]